MYGLRAYINRTQILKWGQSKIKIVPLYIYIYIYISDFLSIKNEGKLNTVIRK